MLQLPGPAQNDLLIHFCGRGTHRSTEQVPESILGALPEERLNGILCDGLIRAFTQHNGGYPAACFCEVDAEFAHFRWLIDERGFAPWGLAFTRERVTKWGGGPVFSSRNDDFDRLSYLAELEREKTGHSVNADYLRSKMTRFEPFDTKPSDWLWEQEWRFTVPGGELALGPQSIAAVIIGDQNWRPADTNTGKRPELWVNSEALFWDGEMLRKIKDRGEE